MACPHKPLVVIWDSMDNNKYCLSGSYPLNRDCLSSCKNYGESVGLPCPPPPTPTLVVPPGLLPTPVPPVHHYAPLCRLHQEGQAAEHMGNITRKFTTNNITTNTIMPIKQFIKLRVVAIVTYPKW